MGDRANVVVVDAWPSDRNPKEGVFLYTHWAGSSLPGTLRDALQSPEGKARANDGSYLARIIFNGMTKDAYSAETGYGISTRLTDNGHPLLVVDVARSVVVEFPESIYEESGFETLSQYPGVKFNEYSGEWQE